MIFVATTTSPVATAIHLHLPQYARTQSHLLERYVASVPPADATIDVTTLSFIGKPRVSRMKLSEFRPISAISTKERSQLLRGRGTLMGLVNWARDTTADNERRKWYQYRAVGRFGVHWSNRGVKHAWVWKALKEKLGVRDAPRAAEARRSKGNYD
jgi:hypothetical protein